MKSSLSWSVLGLLLAATLAGAATLDRRSWPDLVGDEATYLMQAQSLAWDFDLRYSRADYDRFVAQWGRRPEGLILQSADDGGSLVYGKPSSYSFFIAPFVRLSPTRGAAVANALLLALAAGASALALQRRIGAAAPLWVAVFVFASVVFPHVFWVHSDLFLMCLAALALALAHGGAPEARLRPGRWAAAGILLGFVIASRPLYAGLLAAVALAVPRERRRAGLAALAAGSAALILAATLANLASRGNWTSYGGQRQSFYSHTGFPEVDAAAGDWASKLAADGSDAWVKEETLRLGFDPRQTAWNVLYYFAGRHVGLLPYFLPILLGLLAFRGGEGRWALLLAVAFAAVCLFYLRPFNFYGGGGAIANRYFLPIYPAFWFLAARPVRWPSITAILIALLAAPFLWPLWAAPRSFPIDAEGGYRHVSGLARRWLPFETTLSHLKPAGQEDLVHHKLWIRLLTPGLRPEGARLRLEGGRSGQLLIGNERPLAGVRLRLPPGGPAPSRIAGAEVAETIRRPDDGGITLRLRFPRPRARHRMWWTDDFFLYPLRLEPAKEGGDILFQLNPDI